MTPDSHPGLFRGTIAPLLCLLGFAFVAMLGGSVLCGAESVQEKLPPTGDRSALAVDHFPSTLHAVVWRNWSLVPAERIAATLGATAEQVRTLAGSMGLDSQVKASPQWRSRGYITIVRRNWHLLPFEQLLTLLDMSEEQLAFSLREDDFLWIKLGSFKPACPPVLWHEPTADEIARASEIAALVSKHFGRVDFDYADPPFSFVETFQSSVSTIAPDQATAAYRRDASPRFLYSYCGTFGDPLADDSVDPFPDGLLAQLAERGVNGVWLHVVLRQISPPTETFPGFGEGHAARLDRLSALVEKARRYGIRIYLYMNEPRALPADWLPEGSPNQGVREDRYAAMCTSSPEVRQWLTDSLAHVFRKVPELGGVFTITASENLTHCASHGRHSQCPRCQLRTAADIIGEVNSAIAEGVHRSSPEARVICWDWGWNGHGLAQDHIVKLPKDAALMSVSEWDVPIERGGVKTRIGEYSISAGGPGPRATEHWRTAKQAGLKTFAKLQVNNSWEISTVPYLPVGDLVAEHLYRLRQHQIDGAMLSWSLGGYPSPNLLIVQKSFDMPNATADQVLDAVASELYGDAAEQVRKGWTAMSDGFRELPISGSYLYRGPQQVGPANLLYREPTGYASTMVGFPYDDLPAWRGPYPEEVFIGQLDKLVTGWRKAAGHFAAASAISPAALDPHQVAEAALLHFASAADQSRYIVARSSNNPSAMAEALLREIDSAKAMYRLVAADSRLGFEPSNHYFYVPHDLVEKVINCEHLLDALAAD